MAIKLAELRRTAREQAISPATGADPAQVGLAQVCGHAAEHMSKARLALDSESFDTSLALDHLEEAISCLQGLSRGAAAVTAEGNNTVVAFQPAKDRRTA